MKNNLFDFLRYIPGYRSGKNKKIATCYYILLLAIIILPFIKFRKINVNVCIFAMICILVPFLIVGFDKITKGTKEEKLIYFIYPVIFISILIFGVNKYENIKYKSKDKAIKVLGISREKYDYEIKKYDDEYKKLSDNKTLNNSKEYTYEELSSKYNSLKGEYSNLKVENDKKLKTYNDLKSKKEEQDRKEAIAKEKLAKEKAEQEAKAKSEAKKQQNKSNNSSAKKDNNFEVKDGIANHNSSSGYNSPSKDPNRPVATSEYGYVVDGNRYIHKTPSCKFLKGKSPRKVSVSSSSNFKCNCWRY
ncbi:hypothetical protein [Clostridium baratii]|uniref:Predicted membrane protein n=1 Tax=Clostridium baratii TaxID=1561 RepID=A0A174U3Q4_9CLOT|nr:hypothetical protein [Clostridium baratii]CUQ15946.1 Predicted membrane protein [Clostridium baratii]